MIGISGPSLTADESAFIVKNQIGGVILFARNIESPEQLHQLCHSIQELRHQQTLKLPLFIGIDMEGGRVQRLKPPFTKWPALGKIGELDSTTVAFRFAQAMGQELKAIGVNLDFAPCVDVLTNPKNTLIGDRSLGKTPEAVGRLGSALVRGYIKADVIPCAKHFPGHGNTVIDSHEDLPIEDIDLARLQSVELDPFKKIFRSRLGMVMTAHIRYQNIDPQWPATLSQIFLKNILREECRYRNVIISDDLDMKALTKNFKKEEIPVRALEAGCDLLLYCNEPSSPPLAIAAIHDAIAKKRLSEKSIQESFDRVVRLKKDTLADAPETTFEEAKKWIGHPEHVRLAKAIEDGHVPADLLTT
jgi:beta-N-acetylhexosaminidase